MIKALIFDWGDTIMRDFNYPGPMSLWPEVAWIPGAEQALKELYGHYTMIIATSADHSNTQDMISALKRVGADQYFNFFYSQKELGCKKPDPQFFLRSAQLSGQRPEYCMMIGNLYEKDIIGAHQAGMQTVLFNEHHRSGHFPLADFVIGDLMSLIKILDNQRTRN